MSALATAQNAVFSLAQLRELGLSDSAVRKRTAACRLFRIHVGVYSLVPPELLTREGRWTAAVLACGPEAALSHRSAAALHGLRPAGRAAIDVSIPRRSGRRHDGIDIHRATTLTPADVITIATVPVTTVARTIADLLAVAPERTAQRALEQAVVMQILDGRALDDQTARHPHGARLRRLLQRGPINRPTESVMEERLLSECRRAGVPEPERQIYIDLGDAEPMIRADFVWREQRLIVETDGAAAHGTKRAFEDDRRRDQRLARAGWRVIRVTWRQLVAEPDRVIRLIVEMLESGWVPAPPEPG